jgi:hypothetical protein
VKPTEDTKRRFSRETLGLVVLGLVWRSPNSARFCLFERHSAFFRHCFFVGLALSQLSSIFEQCFLVGQSVALSRLVLATRADTQFLSA